jgi:hypothetical protein
MFGSSTGLNPSSNGRDDQAKMPPMARSCGGVDMNREELTAKLEAAGFVIRQIIRMGDDDGWRAMLTNGAVIHCFDDGRCIVHGPSASLLRSVLRAKLPLKSAGIETPLGAASRLETAR